MKLTTLLTNLFFILASINLKGQVVIDSGTIKFILDSSYKKEIKNCRVQIIQGKKILNTSFNDFISLKLGMEFSVDILNSDLMLNGYKKLKIYSDTVIEFKTNSLATVVVSSKKKIVTENTHGFDYYPQNDSILRDQSILMGLQRLPFINGYEFETVPKYRQEGKILFTLNGKQRKGIENNWASILSIIKGKDVYKVELIEDIPLQIRNQGYQAIINILTVEANIYGSTFNAVLFYDQRNNINPSASATFLKKRFDISLGIGRNEDNQIGSRKTEVKNSNFLQSSLETSSKYLFKTKYANIDIGFRKDSLKDFGLNISAISTAFSTKYTPIIQFGINTIGTTSLFEKQSANFNTSYIFRKKEGLTYSFVSALNFASETKGNNLAFQNPKQTDSTAIRTPSYEINWIADYNILDNRNLKYQKEFGIKIYNRDLTQDFERFTVDNNSNELSQLLYSRMDSFATNQYSIRPYTRWGKNISKSKRLTISFTPEIYLIKNTNIKLQTFFLPNVNVGYRKILNTSNSLRYNFSMELVKPNIDYLSTVQLFNDPQQQQVGNAKLVPSKYLGAGVEWVRRKKATFSYSINFGYNFDQLDFFRNIEPSNNLLQSFANNGLTSYRFYSNINYQKQLSKKLWLDASGGIYLNLNKNKIFRTSFNRLTSGTQSNLRLELGKNNGTLSARVFYFANPTSGQGFTQGTRFYGLSYANQFFKKKLAISLIADQFFLKNRNRLNYTKANGLEVFTNSVEPYRFLKVRISYRFSNVKISKMANKKTTDISGESPRL